MRETWAVEVGGLASDDCRTVDRDVGDNTLDCGVPCAARRADMKLASCEVSGRAMEGGTLAAT